MQKALPKIFLLILIGTGFWAFLHFDLNQYLTLEYLKSQKADFRSYYSSHPLKTVAFFMLVYILTTAASIPALSSAALS